MKSLAGALDQLLMQLSFAAPEKYALVLDLLWAVVRGDWHRVADDANDIRVMEAECAYDKSS